MRPAVIIVLVAVVAVSVACTIGTLPGAPSVVAASAVAAVPTDSPGVWDTRDELAAWVDNGATTGPATLVGDGADAVIRIDLASGEALLHGPELDARTSGIVSARLRCRWIGAGKNELLFITMYLRPPNPSANDLYDVPWLSPSFPSQNQLPLIQTSGGNWVDQTMVDGFAGVRVNNTKFVTILIGGGTANGTPRPLHGVVEIDRIQLIGS